MSPLLAWLRVLPILSLFSLLHVVHVDAREQSLFTSSVTYCNPPETLLVQRFEVAYFPANASVSFNVSVSSVQPDVNVTANIFLNAYGLSPVNITLDLCTLFNGALCPLPMYNFTGADSITLPDSVGVEVDGKLPGIALKIPDLEGYAQLSLKDVNTGAIRACIQTTISNGLSAYQPAVVWTSRGISLAALITAVVFSILISPNPLVALRFLDLLQLFQTIAASALLNLNYPSVYRAFALNFAWVIGVIGQEDSPVQVSIDRMRALTGGHVQDDTGGTAIDFVNRRLSPYNSLNAEALLQQIAGPVRRTLETSSRFVNELVSRSKVNLPDTMRGDVQTVTPSSSNVLQAGLPIYVNTVFIPTANAFMTVFISTLCLLAVTLAAFVLGFGVLFLVTKYQDKKHKTAARPIKQVLVGHVSLIKAWLLRLTIFISFPLSIFAFYQFSLKDSWLSVFLAVLTLLAIITALVFPALHIRRAVRQSPEGPASIYDHSCALWASYGTLFAHNKPERYSYTLYVTLPALFLRALLIALFRFSSEAQVALLLSLEVFLLLAHFVLKPYATKGAHIFGGYLIATRMVTTGLMIAFLQKVDLNPIGRVVVGIVCAIIFSVCVVITVGVLAWAVGEEMWACAKSRFGGGGAMKQGGKGGKKKEKWQHDSEGSILEKGIVGGTSTANASKKNSSENAPSSSLPSSRNSIIVLNESNSGHLHLPPTMNHTTLEGASTSSHPNLRSTPLERPLAPTPDHLVPFDSSTHPYTLTPYYPISPTGSTVTSLMDPHSIYSASPAEYGSHMEYDAPSSRRASSDAGTILTNVGSVLPRRWSFTHSAPPTAASGSMMGHGSVVNGSGNGGSGGGTQEPGSPGASSVGHHTAASSVQGGSHYAHSHSGGGLSPSLGHYVPQAAGGGGGSATVSRNASVRTGTGYMHPKHADIQEETASASERSLKSG